MDPVYSVIAKLRDTLYGCLGSLPMMSQQAGTVHYAWDRVRVNGQLFASAVMWDDFHQTVQRHGITTLISAYSGRGYFEWMWQHYLAVRSISSEYKVRIGYGEKNVGPFFYNLPFSL